MDHLKAESNVQGKLTGLLALIRTGSSEHQEMVLDTIESLSWNELSEAQKLEYLRVYGLAFTRLGTPNAERSKRAIAKLDAHYPSGNRDLNVELCQLLVYLQAPNTAAKTIPLLKSAPTQEEQIHYAKSLRLLRHGWTDELTKHYFSWFVQVATYRG